MKRVYLHIGRSKTGSTAIQRALSTNRDALARSGFCYPGQGHDHSCVVRGFRGSQPHAEDTARLATAIRETPLDVILSAEGLMLFPPAQVSDWLAGLSVRVIVYIREQAEAIASGYQQEVKANLEATPFADFAPRFHIPYDRFLDPWAGVFGRENMSVRVYDRDALFKGDLVSDFLSIVGIADASAFTADGSDPNPSIAGALLEAKRRINAGFSGSPEELRRATYPMLLALANENPAWRGRVAADRGLIDGIRAKHRPSNEMVARLYLGRDFAFWDRPWPETAQFTEADVEHASRTIAPAMPPAADASHREGLTAPAHQPAMSSTS